MASGSPDASAMHHRQASCRAAPRTYPTFSPEPDAAKRRGCVGYPAADDGATAPYPARDLLSSRVSSSAAVLPCQSSLLLTRTVGPPSYTALGIASPPLPQPRRSLLARPGRSPRPVPVLTPGDGASPGPGPQGSHFATCKNSGQRTRGIKRPPRNGAAYSRGSTPRPLIRPGQGESPPSPAQDGY